MKFEKEIYCAYCGYAIAGLQLTDLDKSESHKGSHIMKVEIVATCEECDRSTTNMYNNTQDFSKRAREAILRTNDPVHDIIQAEANTCPTCGGSMPTGICRACESIR